MCREGAAGRVSADSAEPRDEGGGEGAERCPGLRGDRRAGSGHRLGQRHRPNRSRGT